MGCSNVVPWIHETSVYDEICFYDALIQNTSGQELMQDELLKVIAAELVTTVRKSVTIGWTLRVCQGQNPGHRPHPEEVRLPARPVGRRGQAGAGTG